MVARALGIGFFLVQVLFAPDVRAEKVSAQALELAKSKGQVRVMLMLHGPVDRRAIDPDLRQHAGRVGSSVDAVLAALPQRGHKVLRRFSVVPAVSMEADLPTLQRLRDHPGVRRIDLDAGGSGGGFVAPDAASILNGVGNLADLGFAGKGMKVAVIDSGVDTDHVDLQSRLVGQQCFCSNSNDVGGCCPNGQAIQTGAGAAEDDDGHGTNVSGIIVGQGQAAPRGVAPAAQLVSVKVLDRDGRFCCSSDVVAAMDWIAMQHPDVDVVNLSLGTNAMFAGDCDGATAFTQAMAAAVDALVARGAVVVASTGNDASSSQTQAPACVRKTVGVGATWDFSDGPITFLGCSESSTAPRQPTCFTNRSTTTDIYAAGAFVTATGFNGATSTYAGTSQAAPMVAGCALALKQAAPLSTVEQRADAMKLSSIRVGDPVSGRSYPFLDCMDAIRLLNPAAFDPIEKNCSGSLPRPILPASPPSPTSISQVAGSLGTSQRRRPPAASIGPGRRAMSTR